MVRPSRSFAINPIPSVQAVLLPRTTAHNPATPARSALLQHTSFFHAAMCLVSHALPSAQNPISSSWLPRRARASCKAQAGLRELLLSDTFFAQAPDLCLLQHSLCWSLTPVCLLPDEPQSGNWVPRSSLRPREMASCSANNRPRECS